MKNKILPCPLCAGEAYFVDIRDGGGVIQCECCGCETGWAENEEQAIKAWNRRLRTWMI